MTSGIGPWTSNIKHLVLRTAISAWLSTGDNLDSSFPSRPVTSGLSEVVLLASMNVAHLGSVSIVIKKASKQVDIRLRTKIGSEGQFNDFGMIHNQLSIVIRLEVQIVWVEKMALTSTSAWFYQGSHVYNISPNMYSFDEIWQLL